MHALVAQMYRYQYIWVCTTVQYRTGLNTSRSPTVLGRLSTAVGFGTVASWEYSIHVLGIPSTVLGEGLFGHK